MAIVPTVRGAGATFFFAGSRARGMLSSTFTGEEHSMVKTSKRLTKSALFEVIANAVGEDTTRKQVSAILGALTEIGHRELKKNGAFVLPGFAKFLVRKKPARPARQGINPFTKQPMTFAAKPASKAVRARPVKAIKDAIG